MKICKNCIHYKLCEYSTFSDRETKCKDFLSKDFIKEFVEKLIEKHSWDVRYETEDAYYVQVVCVGDIEDFAKEMGGEWL